MKKVSGPQVVTAVEAVESSLPPQIQEALGELVGAAREGLLALSVGVGLGVVHELMELEVSEVVGAKGKHNPGRTAKRHGHEDGSMTLGGRRVAVSRPRVRTADDERELPVASYEYFADRDPLTRAVMDRMLAGVSTRKFARVGEPVGEQVQRTATSTRKSTVSELFIEKTRTALCELMARRLDDARLAVMMLDGLEIAGRVHVVALGITTEGVKVPLGLWEGSTENATLARSLLADLVDRGLDPGQAILFVLDGGKALRRAIKDVFGEYALVHRCHRHKERNVCDLLPERDRPAILARIRGAWALKDPEEAEQQLELLASELQRSWPDAATSLREGMPETLTLMGLGITGPTRKDAVLDERDRVDDRDRPAHPAQRQALAGRRHAQAMDGRRDAPSRAAVPARDRLHRSLQARDRDRTPPAHPRKPEHTATLGGDYRDRRRRSTRYRLTITIPVGSPSKFHDEPGNLRLSLTTPNLRTAAQPAVRLGSRGRSVALLFFSAPAPAHDQKHRDDDHDHDDHESRRDVAPFVVKGFRPDHGDCNALRLDPRDQRLLFGRRIHDRHLAPPVQRHVQLVLLGAHHHGVDVTAGQLTLEGRQTLLFGGGRG